MKVYGGLWWLRIVGDVLWWLMLCFECCWMPMMVLEDSRLSLMDNEGVWRSMMVDDSWWCVVMDGWARLSIDQPVENIKKEKKKEKKYYIISFLHVINSKNSLASKTLSYSGAPVWVCEGIAAKCFQIPKLSLNGIHSINFSHVFKHFITFTV